MWAGSLAGRLGREGWSAWGLYLVTGTLQGGLLAMAVWFEFVRGKGGGKGNGYAGHGDAEGQGRDNGNGVGNDERAGLLANEQ